MAQPAPQPHRHGANRRRENPSWPLCWPTIFCKAGLHRPLFQNRELLAEIKFAKVDGSFPKLRKQLATFDLILLDEWLRDALSPNDARDNPLTFLMTAIDALPACWPPSFPLTSGIPKFKIQRWPMPFSTDWSMTPCGFPLKGSLCVAHHVPSQDEPDLISEASSMT